MDGDVFDMENENHLLDGARIYHRNERNGAPLLMLEKGIAAKLFLKKNKLLHFIRVATKTTKAHKHWAAAQTLSELGLNTPKPLEVKVFDGRGKFEASFHYEFLEEAEPLREALLKRERQPLLSKLASDLIIMYKSGVLFMDFHLGNVLVDPVGKLYWIDLEFTYNEKRVVSQFWLRMERMHRKCDLGLLSEDEWEFFCQQLKVGLNRPN